MFLYQNFYYTCLKLNQASSVTFLCCLVIIIQEYNAVKIIYYQEILHKKVDFICKLNRDTIKLKRDLGLQTKISKIILIL